MSASVSNSPKKSYPQLSTVRPPVPPKPRSHTEASSIRINELKPQNVVEETSAAVASSDIDQAHAGDETPLNNAQRAAETIGVVSHNETPIVKPIGIDNKQPDEFPQESLESKTTKSVETESFLYILLPPMLTVPLSLPERPASMVLPKEIILKYKALHAHRGPRKFKPLPDLPAIDFSNPPPRPDKFEESHFKRHDDNITTDEEEVYEGDSPLDEQAEINYEEISPLKTSSVRSAEPNAPADSTIPPTRKQSSPLPLSSFSSITSGPGSWLRRTLPKSQIKSTVKSLTATVGNIASHAANVLHSSPSETDSVSSRDRLEPGSTSSVIPVDRDDLTPKQISTITADLHRRFWFKPSAGLPSLNDLPTAAILTDAKGKSLNLKVSSGETVCILRKNGNPPGLLLACLATDISKYGYVKEDIIKTMGCPSDECIPTVEEEDDDSDYLEPSPQHS